MKTLIKHCNLISVEPDRELFEKDIDILIENDIIKKISKNINEEANKIIDAKNKVVMPGLINTHAHVPMSIFKENLDGYSLQEWLTQKIWPAEAKLTNEDIYNASLMSFKEMIRTGTTTIVDMYFMQDNIIKAAKKANVRIELTRTLMDSDGNGDKKLEELENLLNQYKDRVLKTEERNYLKEENGELKVITAEEKEKERAQKEQTKDEIDKAIRKHEKEERKEPEKEEEQQEKTESPQIEDSDKVLRIVRVKEVEEYSKILGKDIPPTADIYIVEYSDNKFRTVVKQNGKYEMVGGLEYHKLNQEIISGVEGLENQVNGTIRENELTAGKSTDENRYDVLVINDKTFSERETMIKYGRDAQTDVKDIEIRRNGKHIKVLDSEGLYPDEISLEGKPVRVSEELEVEAKREKRKEQKLNEQKAREEEETGEEKTLWNSY